MCETERGWLCVCMCMRERTKCVRVLERKKIIFFIFEIKKRKRSKIGNLSRASLDKVAPRNQKRK